MYIVSMYSVIGRKLGGVPNQDMAAVYEVTKSGTKPC